MAILYCKKSFRWQETKISKFCLSSLFFRYLCLLAKVHPENPDVSPLPFVLQLLHSKSVHSSVCAMIVQMVENLLAPQEEDMKEDDEDFVIDAGSTVIDVNSQTG